MFQQPGIHLPPKASRAVGQAEDYNASVEKGAVDGNGAFAQAESSDDDHVLDGVQDKEPHDDALESTLSMLTVHNGTRLQSENQFWSAGRQKQKKKFRDFLVAASLSLLFAAGVVRTSIPSLLYIIFSVQALYSERGGLASPFHVISVACTTVVAAGMILFHLIINSSTTVHSALLLQVLNESPALPTIQSPV